MSTVYFFIDLGEDEKKDLTKISPKIAQGDLSTTSTPSNSDLLYLSRKKERDLSEKEEKKSIIKDIRDREKNNGNKKTILKAISKPRTFIIEDSSDEDVSISLQTSQLFENSDIENLLKNIKKSEKAQNTENLNKFNFHDTNNYYKKNTEDKTQENSEIKSKMRKLSKESNSKMIPHSNINPISQKNIKSGEEIKSKDYKHKETVELKLKTNMGKKDLHSENINESKNSLIDKNIRKSVLVENSEKLTKLNDKNNGLIKNNTNKSNHSNLDKNIQNFSKMNDLTELSSNKVNSKTINPIIIPHKEFNPPKAQIKTNIQSSNTNSQNNVSKNIPNKSPILKNQVKSTSILNDLFSKDKEEQKPIKSDIKQFDKKPILSNLSTLPQTSPRLKTKSLFNIDLFNTFKRNKFSNPNSFYEMSMKDNTISKYLSSNSTSRQLFLSQYSKFICNKGEGDYSIYNNTDNEKNILNYIESTKENGINYCICKKNGDDKRILISEKMFKRYAKSITQEL